MRVVVLGASGLIGHKLYDRLRHSFDVHPVLHRSWSNEVFHFDRAVEGIDVRRIDVVEGVIRALRPDVVLNCAGITKRKPEINDMEQAVHVNAMFPHSLARLLAEIGGRLIQFSTDCVFDGSAGPYREDSETTARDTYGRTKALGEVVGLPHVLTLRSSFIGRELSGHSELLEWFLAQRGRTIKGFAQVFYSGVSTIEMARVVADVIERHPALSGLYQLAMPQPISKYELLCVARDAFDVDVTIEKDESVVSMPTLDGSRLSAAIGLSLPDWPTMLRDLAADRFYEELT